MRLPAGLSLSEEVALETFSYQIYLDAPNWELSNSEWISLLAAILSAIALAVSGGLAIAASRKSDRLFAFDTVYGDPIKGLLDSLSRSATELGQIAAIRDGRKRKPRLIAFQKQQFDPWFWTFEQLLSASDYRRASQIQGELYAILDQITDAINTMSEPGYTPSSGDAAADVVRSVTGFRIRVSNLVLADRHRKWRKPEAMRNAA